MIPVKKTIVAYDVSRSESVTAGKKSKRNDLRDGHAQIMAFALALAAMFGLPSDVLAIPANNLANEDSIEVNRLFREARATANYLKTNTGEMQSYPRLRLDWRTHARQASVVGEQVNELGATLQELEAMQSEAALWQQRTIQEMRPILAELARTTELVIEHIRENPLWLRYPAYRENLDSKHELASRLVDLTKDSVNYGAARENLGQLTTKLGID